MQTLVDKRTKTKIFGRHERRESAPQVQIDQDNLTSINSKRIIRANDPFELGSTDLNISNALDYYREQIEKRHRKELENQEQQSLLKYLEKKRKDNGE